MGVNVPTTSLSATPTASTSTATCCSAEITSLAHALENYQPAVSLCSSIYPEIYGDLQVTAVTSTSSFTTTIALCAPLTSSTSQPTTSTTLSPTSTTSVNKKASKAFKSLTRLPSPCISSVCTQDIGNPTTTETLTSYSVATEYAPAIETCRSTDFCDKGTVGGPVCRPYPSVNSCPAFYNSEQPEQQGCQSTNGCSGACFFTPSESGLAGVCAIGNLNVYNGGYVKMCGNNTDCGPGQVCSSYPGVTFSYSVCFEAASETC